MALFWNGSEYQNVVVNGETFDNVYVNGVQVIGGGGEPPGDPIYDHNYYAPGILYVADASGGNMMWKQMGTSYGFTTDGSSLTITIEGTDKPYAYLQHAAGDMDFICTFDIDIGTLPSVTAAFVSNHDGASRNSSIEITSSGTYTIETNKAEGSGTNLGFRFNNVGNVGDSITITNVSLKLKNPQESWSWDPNKYPLTVDSLTPLDGGYLSIELVNNGDDTITITAEIDPDAAAGYDTRHRLRIDFPDVNTATFVKSSSGFPSGVVLTDWRIAAAIHVESSGQAVVQWDFGSTSYPDLDLRWPEGTTGTFSFDVQLHETTAIIQPV